MVTGNRPDDREKVGIYEYASMKANKQNHQEIGDLKLTATVNPQEKVTHSVASYHDEATGSRVFSPVRWVL
jgi:hypothetical protein